MVVADVAASKEFEGFASFALPLGIRAGWSAPIVSSRGVVLGTIATYYRDLREPRPDDDLLGDIATRTAAIIIERTRSEESLRANEARSAAEAQALARLNELSSRLWRMRSLREGLDEMLTATIELLGADRGNVQMLDAQRGVLLIAAQHGFKQDFLDFFREVSAEDRLGLREGPAVGRANCGRGCRGRCAVRAASFNRPCIPIPRSDIYSADYPRWHTAGYVVDALPLRPSAKRTGASPIGRVRAAGLRLHRTVPN